MEAYLICCYICYVFSKSLVFTDVGEKFCAFAVIKGTYGRHFNTLYFYPPSVKFKNFFYRNDRMAGKL